jgi:hypothetical protein
MSQDAEMCLKAPGAVSRLIEQLSSYILRQDASSAKTMTKK